MRALIDHGQQLLDELELVVADGGVILDWHTCEPFPERWVDLVVVLRCDHSKLWERLEKRYSQSFLTDIVVLCWLSSGYALKKIQENNEAEIMQVVLEEAQLSYAPEIVIELSSETSEDLESNVERILKWITQWTRNQKAV